MMIARSGHHQRQRPGGHLAIGHGAPASRKRSGSPLPIDEEVPARKAKAPRHLAMPAPSHVDLVLGYQEALPIEVQYVIMCRLAEHNPKSVLCLAATSKQQAAVLDRLLPRLARENPLIVAVEGGATPTAADYLRARVALGGEDTNVAVPLRLMEGFVRFFVLHARMGDVARDQRRTSHRARTLPAA
ncbi:hypothetical protein pneo_cds_436 [Pandoravirus neocaledonia]|uniref:Uncharacterized protein n=1 Tax=Pandoravirus neocaledonia TaxID=2107708 RepID=A0A2U7UC83_9VIRU|nr:hypothetical protein pneo_cds_436 [Pandoravirus neocaledonia]AVK76043.1 hypothetical protein pneo_cds_436 [Pandoravirus neocaledonia]